MKSKWLKCSGLSILVALAALLATRALAGWQTTQSRTFVVQVPIEGLANAKLNAAIKAQDRGQLNTAVNNLNAFVSEVEAQTNKHITPQAAAILIRDTQYLISQFVQ